MCIRLDSASGYTFYMITGSMVFQVLFSERESKCRDGRKEGKDTHQWLRHKRPGEPGRLSPRGGRDRAAQPGPGPRLGPAHSRPPTAGGHCWGARAGLRAPMERGSREGSRPQLQGRDVLPAGSPPRPPSPLSALRAPRSLGPGRSSRWCQRAGGPGLRPGAVSGGQHEVVVDVGPGHAGGCASLTRRALGPQVQLLPWSRRSLSAPLGTKSCGPAAAAVAGAGGSSCAHLSPTACSHGVSRTGVRCSRPSGSPGPVAHP